MSPCHNLEPSLVARDSSRLLSVKPNEWMHLSPFYTRMHGEWLRYAKSTSQFHWRFLLVRDVRGFQVNPLCRHDITSPFPPSGNGGYVRNLDVTYVTEMLYTESRIFVRHEKIRIRFDSLRFWIHSMHFDRKGWGIRNKTEKRTWKFRTQWAMTLTTHNYSYC